MLHKSTGTTVDWKINFLCNITLFFSYLSILCVDNSRGEQRITLDELLLITPKRAWNLYYQNRQKSQQKSQILILVSGKYLHLFSRLVVKCGKPSKKSKLLHARIHIMRGKFISMSLSNTAM